MIRAAPRLGVSAAALTPDDLLIEPEHLFSGLSVPCGYPIPGMKPACGGRPRPRGLKPTQVITFCGCPCLRGPGRFRGFHCAPLARLGTPEEVAGAVRFLCSDEDSFVT